MVPIGGYGDPKWDVHARLEQAELENERLRVFAECAKTRGVAKGYVLVTERYAVDRVLPDEPTAIYDLAQHDEPCVYPAQNADEAARWIEAQP